jgi:hypothetical protein
MQRTHDHAGLPDSRISEVTARSTCSSPGLSRHGKNTKLRAADKIFAALDPMKKDNTNSADEKLGTLLRESRTFPALPPRFQQNVWRRIEDAKAPLRSESRLDALSALILRPRFALAAAAALVLIGSFAGALEGRQAARHEAQMNYLASVAPQALR